MDISAFSKKTKSVIKISQEICREFRHEEILPEHLFLALIRSGYVTGVLKQADKSPNFLTEQVEKVLKTLPLSESFSPSASVEYQSCLLRASDERESLKDSEVEPIHILLGLLDSETTIDEEFRKNIMLTKSVVYDALSEVKMVAKISDAEGGVEGEAPLLNYCRDMIEMARSGELDPVVGREDDIKQVMEILLRRRKNNPVVIGEPGVGKTAIIEGLAQNVVAGTVPKHLKGLKILSLDLAQMVAGAKYKGEFEERMNNLISDLAKIKKPVALFIDEIHSIISTGGGGGGMDAAHILKPALARGRIQMIGATTTDEFKKHLEKDKALTRRFQRVILAEPDIDQSVQILNGIKVKYEEHHSLKYSDEAIKSAVTLSKRYMTDRQLPDKAIDLLDQSAATYNVNRERFFDEKQTILTEIDEMEKKLSSGSTDMDELKKAVDQLSERVAEIESTFAYRDYQGKQSA
jgi:ATP-dependent Clp protease ATP-binding subunit ClpB